MDIFYIVFNNLRRLKELYMVDMGIKVFDKRLLEYLLMLKVLDFYGNKFKYFDWMFMEILIFLFYIDILGNFFLELLNFSIVNLCYIKLINLSKNNWKCNCVLEWVKVLFFFILEFVDCSGFLFV